MRRTKKDIPSIVKIKVENCKKYSLVGSINCGKSATKNTIALGLLIPTKKPSLNIGIIFFFFI